MESFQALDTLDYYLIMVPKEAADTNGHWYFLTIQNRIWYVSPEMWPLVDFQWATNILFLLSTSFAMFINFASFI